MCWEGREGILKYCICAIINVLMYMLVCMQKKEETFWAHDLEYCLKPQIERGKGKPANLRFGEHFSDHMLMIKHSRHDGWDAPHILPLGPLQMHPGSQVLHYGLSCFEGLKAYKGPDGQARLFRPEMNMQRLLRSAQRLHLPSFCPNELLECIKALVKVDKEWIPTELGTSLYIRPVLFSSSNFLGVSSARESIMSVILSPTGAYFTSENQSIKMFIEEDHTRAWPGGAGDSKVSGNYAPTIYPQSQAAETYGAHQVVYTFDAQRNCSEGDHGSMRGPSKSLEDVHFEECGAMNIFFVFDRGNHIEIVTPELSNGTILPGVTRASIIELIQDWDNIKVRQRRVTLREVQEACTEGKLMEIFACGTASLVQPIECLIRKGGEVWKPQTSAGPLTKRIYDELIAIQHGMHHNHPWSCVIT